MVDEIVEMLNDTLKASLGDIPTVRWRFGNIFRFPRIYQFIILYQIRSFITLQHFDMFPATTWITAKIYIY